MAINTSSMAKYNGIMSVRRSDKMLAESIFRENKKGGRKTVRKKNEEPEKTEHLSPTLLSSAECGPGIIIVGASTFITEEDRKLADEMDREIIRKQHAVIDYSYDK